jgi:hypothetical protein
VLIRRFSSRMSALLTSRFKSGFNLRLIARVKAQVTAAFIRLLNPALTPVLNR